MTWNEMKEFCNSLDESKLQNNVILWRENESITKIFAELLDQYHYIDPENYENGCFPEDEAKSVIMSSDELENIDDLKKVYGKGDPILCEEF